MHLSLKQIFLMLALLVPVAARAQYQGTERPAGDTTLVLSLEDAIRIALSENTSVKVADLEVQRQEYAHKGTYAALFPQVSGSGSYQRTIKKQVMYMGGSSDDENGGGMAGMYSSMMEPIYYYLEQLMAQHPGAIQPYVPAPVEDSGKSGSDGFEVGRLNTFSVGVSAAMPLGEHLPVGRPGGAGCGKGPRVAPGHGNLREAGLLRRAPGQGSLPGVQERV